MTIELISQEQYDRLVAIQKDYPNLTYQNKAYDRPNMTKWSEEELALHKEISDLLNKHIIGFREFNHFKVRPNGNIVLRFQYKWTEDEESPKISFTGVGYIGIHELLNGFN